MEIKDVFGVILFLCCFIVLLFFGFRPFSFSPDCSVLDPFGSSRNWCLLNQPEKACSLLLQVDSARDLPLICEKWK